VRSSKTNNEERRVRARHDVTQVYRRQGVRRTASQQDLPRGDMIINGDPNPNNSSSSSDDDIEDNTYIPSPRACPHGKGFASASGSGVAANEEIKEEVEEEDDAADE
jgi:hypothetical protein